MKLQLWKKVILGMLLGILCGSMCTGCYTFFKPIATIYTNLVKMIVVPTVFCAVLYGLTNISSIHALGRIGIKALVLYIAATLFAVGLGIVFATFFTPGLGFTLSEMAPGVSDIIPIQQTSIQEIIVNMFPANPIDAMARGNTLQIIVFAFLLGLSVIFVGDKADEVKHFVRSMMHVIFKMVEFVIKTTPYGVFAIMAWTVGEHGITFLFGLGKLILVIMGAYFFQYILFGIMLLIAGLNPLRFYAKTSNIQSMAIATSSSKAALATALQELRDKVGVSSEVSGFVLPLGATINMGGTAIYLAVCALFFAQTLGVELGFYQYVLLIVTSTLGSIGAAGYPGGGVLMLSMVLPALGLPIDGIPFILGIDRFIDMFRTHINVTGDCTITVIVDKLNGTLNLEKYDKQ